MNLCNDSFFALLYLHSVVYSYHNFDPFEMSAIDYLLVHRALNADVTSYRP